MNDYDKAHWLADKIVVWDDYTKEAAFVLKRQAEELASMKQQLAEAKKDAERMHFGLENCRLLASRYRKEDWALLILGFCAEAGVAGSVTR